MVSNSLNEEQKYQQVAQNIHKPTARSASRSKYAQNTQSAVNSKNAQPNLQKQSSSTLVDNQGSDQQKVQFQQSQCSTKASYTANVKRGKTAKMTTRPKPIEQNDDFQIGPVPNTGTHAEYQDMMRKTCQLDPNLIHSTHFKKNHQQARKVMLSVHEQQETQGRP